jgi:uncharacterized protein YjdB/polygalacturonase
VKANEYNHEGGHLQMLKVKRWFHAVLALALMASVLIIPIQTAQAAPELTMDAGAAPAEIFPYDQSTRYSASTNFTIKANGVPIPVIKAYNDYDYAHFSMSGGPVTYEVTILNTDKVHEYAISPMKLGIKADSVVGRTLTITTQKDEYLIITMNNRTTRLVIAADPAETDIPASSGEGIYNITDVPYQVTTTGVQTGVTERTAAIQKAIDDASSYGTGRGNNAQGVVYVPAGTYYIGNLILKSNTAIYMQPGATFVGTGKTADYTEHWFKNSMGRPATWWISTAFNSQNIKIYGRGTIDGNGKLLHDDKSTNNKGMINNLVVPIATSNFTMDGVIIRESAGWAVMPVRSNDLVFTNLKMFNSLGMGENDGIDIVESQNAVVRNSIGIALDDPYSTKAWQEDTDIASGKVPWPGNPEPVSNVLIEDSITWTLCYGYKIGQGVMQNQDNITFKDGVVYKAAVGFAIHHKYGDGSVSNVTFKNIDVEDISGKNEDNSAWMTLFTVNHNNNGVGPITGVTVEDITVRDAGESFAKIKGQEGALITGITFENVYMPGSSKPATTLHEMNFTDREFYSGVTIKPVQEQEPRPRTNLALKQTAVGSSSDGSTDTASLAFDGNFTTRFVSKRGVDPGWLYVDLGESKRINEVRLNWEAAFGKSYQIQVSDDAENWTNVFSTTSGKGSLETVAFNEVSARYVRMYGTVRATQFGYSIWEFEVYGPEILADSIKLDKTKLDMLTGMTEQLAASLLPENTTNKKAFWTSSNPNVASVNDSGLVTASSSGTATITAATSNGEFLATAAVTVTEIGTPSLHAAIAGDGQVSLNWDAVEGATSYQIFSHAAEGSYGEALATVNSSITSYKSEGLSNGTTYFFVIKAVYPGGESAASNEVNATPQVAPVLEAPELQDITEKKAGDTVTITGLTKLSTLTIKVLRPDQSILYVNVLKGGNFSDSFTLPKDAMIGTYTIVAGSGDVRTVKRFEVIEETGSGSEVLAEEISLNPSVYTMAVGSQAQFTATVLPVNATNKTVIWSVYNETGQAQIDQQGVLTAIKAGMVTIKATAKDGSGIAGSSLVTITQKNDGGDNESSNNGSNPNHVLPSVIPVMKDGNAFVQLDKNQTSVLVSMKDIQDRALQVKARGVSVTIDQKELKYLLSKAGTMEEAIVQVKLEPVSGSVSQAQQGAAFSRISGQIYEIKVSLLTKDHREIKAEQLHGSVEISLPFDKDNTDPLLLGVYYYNEQMDQWEFIGGNTNPDTATITVQLKHLSKYAVIEYRKSFDDVNKGHWVARTLEVLSARHIVTGKTENLFVPGDKTTRAEFTAMLIRALGLTANTTANASPFTDVDNNAWFAGAVQAAYGAGLVKGVTDTEFAPHAAITREQMAIMLVNAYEFKHGKISLAAKPLQSFEDGADVSEWAVEAVNKALAVKVMQGVKDGEFDPKSQATRAQNAQAIYNLLLEEE